MLFLESPFFNLHTVVRLVIGGASRLEHRHSITTPIGLKSSAVDILGEICATLPSSPLKTRTEHPPSNSVDTDRNRGTHMLTRTRTTRGSTTPKTTWKMIPN